MTRSRRSLLILGGTTFVSRLLLLSPRGVMADPDAVAMVAGMVLRMRCHLPPAETMFYGRTLSPATYALVDFLYPLTGLPPSALATTLNVVSAAAFALAVVALVHALERVAPAHRARAVGWLFAFAPLSWSASISFHPVVPAMALLLLSVALAAWSSPPALEGRTRLASTRDAGPAGTPRSAAHARARLAFAVALLALAVVVRAEVIVVLPGLVLAAAWSGDCRRRFLIALATAVATAAVAHVVLGNTWAGEASVAAATAGPGNGGVLRYGAMIATMYRETFSLRGIPRTVTWFVLASGVVTCMLVMRGVSTALRCRGQDRVATRLSAVAAVWALPSILFWLPQPVPILRHYLLSLAGLCVIAARGLPTRGRRGRIALAVVVVLNVAVPEVAWRAWNATHPNARKWPHGSVFADRSRTLERIRPARELAGRLAAIVRSGQERPVVAVVGWEGYAYARYALASASPHPAAGTRRVLHPGVFEVNVPTGAAPVTLIFHVRSDPPPEAQQAIERAVREHVSRGARRIG